MSDDMKTMEEGDLGFGQGLKPGAISTQDMDPPSQRLDLLTAGNLPGSSYNSFGHFHWRNRVTTSQNAPEAQAWCADVAGKRGTQRNQQGSARRLKRSNSLGSVSRQNERRPSPKDREEIPMFAGVLMGTSLRQQRELFQKNMKEYLHKKEQIGKASKVKGSAIPASYFEVQESIISSLQAATVEVTVLTSELEACRSQLDSKYRAIRILQNQVAAMNAEKQKNVDVALSQARTLQKEVNALQFELDAKSSTFMFSEQTWANRFDRLSLENTALLATLHTRSDEVRRLHGEKMALARERDELIAMMDANERLLYDRHSAPKNEDYLQDSVLEQLAMLGSCLCRGNNPEPCRCARTAALLKKENSAVKDENFSLEEKLQEAYLVADAFRKAFDEQLNRNSSMSRQLADSSQDTPKAPERNGTRWKPRLMWKRKGEAKNGHSQPENISQLLAETMGIQALVIGEFDEEIHDQTRSIGVQVSQPMPDLIRNMAELLNDKSEALAHQRLVTKMLARRTQDLEATMKKYGDF